MLAIKTGQLFITDRRTVKSGNISPIRPFRFVKAFLGRFTAFTSVYLVVGTDKRLSSNQLNELDHVSRNANLLVFGLA